MVCKGTYFPPITINYHYYIYSTNETNNTILYLIKVINEDVHVRCHYYNDIVTSTATKHQTDLPPPPGADLSRVWYRVAAATGCLVVWGIFRFPPSVGIIEFD